MSSRAQAPLLGCSTCGLTDALQQCRSCKKYYCNHDHPGVRIVSPKERVHNKHIPYWGNNCTTSRLRSWGRKIKKAERRLKRTLGNDVLERHAGKLGIVDEAKEYLQVRHEHAYQLLRHEEAHGVNELLWLLYLDGNPKNGYARTIATLLLRRGKDEMCYDFCKCWIRKPESETLYNTQATGDIVEPLSHIKGSLEVMKELAPCLSLLKTRVYVDLKNMRIARTTLGYAKPFLPLELVDQVVGYLVDSDAVSCRLDIVTSDQGSLHHMMKDLQDSIKILRRYESLDQWT